MKRKTVAFFDLDNTLIKGAALYHLGKGLIRYNLIRKAEIRIFARAQFKFRATSKEPKLTSLVDKALALLSGRDREKIENATLKIVDEFLPLAIHQGALELLRVAKEQYDDVWILSAAPDQLVKIIAKKLNLTGGVGTMLEVKDGLYTGKILGDFHHGQSKSKTVEKLSKENGYDLKKSATFSDSFNDLPLLESCGLANAVNPDRKLRKHAKRKFWPIRDINNRYRNFYRIALLLYTLLTIELTLKIFG